MTPYAQLAIPSCPLRRIFTYRIPEGMAGRLTPGQRLLVEFRRKKTIGILLGFTPGLPSEVPPEKIKTVEAILDARPCFSKELLELIEWLADYYVAPVGEVCRAALPAQLLRSAGVKAPSPRLLPEEHPAFHQPEPLRLNPEQSEAAQKILEEGKRPAPRPILLHGITGSGKTEIYLTVIKRLLEEGKSAILLVPEINLTPQLMGRVQGRFRQTAGGQVKTEIAVYHSAVSDSWRRRYWNGMREGKIRVVVGTRSALFAPLQNLGAIIVDEEQDGSYKQSDGTFHYHARDAAIVRAKIEKAAVILGSATPSLESFHNARKGKYLTLPLLKRATGASLPETELIDLRKEPMTKDSAILSQKLKRCMDETLYRGEQVLLLLNRRGFANFLLCQDCGKTLDCPNCAVSLTYHKRPPRLLCHYCDLGIPVPEACPSCHSAALKALGEGTQKLEEELKKFFPSANIARLDRDTSAQREFRNTVLARTQKGEVDILLGTQMVAKGHDFPNVTLVGILLADTSLHLPDFRAAEKTFQLITQASGRSGRGNRPGKVLIQTFHPEHYTLLHAAQHQFEQFTSEELRAREDLNYPPFSRMAQIRLQGNDAGRVEGAAKALKLFLERSGGSTGEILGPCKAPLARLKGKYRWQIFLKAADAAALKERLRRVTFFSENNIPAAVHLHIDVDCVHLF